MTELNGSGALFCRIVVTRTHAQDSVGFVVVAADL